MKRLVIFSHSQPNIQYWENKNLWTKNPAKLAHIYIFFSKAALSLPMTVTMFKWLPIFEYCLLHSLFEPQF